MGTEQIALLSLHLQEIGANWKLWLVSSLSKQPKLKIR